VEYLLRFAVSRSLWDDEPVVTVDDQAVMGRRARKKLATREALQRAALRLALAHGTDQVTIEAICREADVSPRTFFNHFSTKDEVMAGDGPHLPGPDELAGLAAGGSGDLWDDIRVLLRAGARGISGRREELRQRRTLMDRHPELLAQHLTRFAAFEQDLIKAVAARCGTADHEVYPQLVAGIAMTTMRVSVRRWVTAEGHRPLEHYLDEAFDVIKSRQL
jgi:AcrR family transcriptional regulator